ncbi:replication protein [Halobacillus litoralis]|uniref:DnaD domain-containing protein n=1 Tax=Halobacillus litoralis TaxID=45668 RepID=A0A410MDM6_9BACI|nr:replication protein [Halobacillus litoralis]QAS52831.1 hypothetical protein HLI_11800 [Halobacillus litoralis]
MANPQTENGYIKIANEIIDEVIRRDFSKRQTAILHMIWRLSYGCNKKSAVIPKLKDFALCGVSKQNVTSELEHLETCRVIYWDRSTNEFTFNKDYEKWIITPRKGWKMEQFKEILRLNLSEKFLKQEQKSSQNKNSEDAKSSQNKNFETKKVLKIRTSEFLKQELPHGQIPSLSKVQRLSKDIIKDIKDKDIKRINNNKESQKVKAFDHYQKNIGPLPPAVIEKINSFIDDLGDDLVVEAITKSCEQNQRRWAYIEKILNNWYNQGIRTLDDVAANDAEFQRKMDQKHSSSSNNSKDIIPDWFDKQDQNNSSQTQSSLDDDARILNLGIRLNRSLQQISEGSLSRYGLTELDLQNIKNGECTAQEVLQSKSKLRVVGS